MRIPCDGCQIKRVDQRRDWMYLYELKVTVCDDCADTRFDQLYDRVTFDWWELDLEQRMEAKKREMIARLGSMSPTAIIDEREAIARSYRRSARG